MIDEKQLRQTILNALKEDIGEGDWTTLWLIPEDKKIEAKIVVHEPGVIAGLEVAKMVFEVVESDFIATAGPVADFPPSPPTVGTPATGGPQSAPPTFSKIKVKFASLIKDGSKVKKGEVVARVSGPARTILTVERTALNFLQRMSGIATLTRKFVEAVEGTGVTILDTRKTAPGLRLIDKWAVTLGGGENHRMGLYDMVLAKDNHLKVVGGVRKAMERLKVKNKKNLEVEIEVENFNQLEEAFKLGVKRILLDNMTCKQIREAVRITNGRAKLEVSGGVTLENVRQLAQTGVDYISVGVLTHSAKALDISLEVDLSSSS